MGCMCAGAKDTKGDGAVKELFAQDLVGKRVLLKLNSKGYFENQSVEEYRVLEVSPSGQWVRLMNVHGNKFWRALTEIAFVEELVSLRAGHPEGESREPTD